MKKTLLLLILIAFASFCLSGCAPLIIGGAAGALGAYAVGRDTIQAETDIPYDHLWEAAQAIAKVRGSIEVEDYAKGYIKFRPRPNRVWVNLLRLTPATTRVKVSARRYIFPNLTLAQDVFVRMIEEAK